MEALQKRGVALLLCALMIAGSCVLGTGASLRRLRAQSEAVFYQEQEGSAPGIQYDLRELASQCYNITVIAGRYLPPDERSITEVLRVRDELTAASTPREKSRAASELVAAANILRGNLEAADLREQDKILLEKTAINIENTLSLISASDYNASASYYNRALGRFPANLLATLTGAKPLELYQ